VTRPLHLQLILGSTREGRAADRILPWLLDRIGSDEAFELELLDLRDWPLPMFQETGQGLAAPGGPAWSDPVVGEWNATVARGDAYLFVTPEYNHSVPGVLKNAIDSVVTTYAFRNKPAAFVGYSGGMIAGARAVEHLAHIAIEAEMAPLRNTVLIGGIRKWDGSTEPADPVSDTALRIMLEDLAWWGRALRAAREAGELKPARQRTG